MTSAVLRTILVAVADPEGREQPAVERAAQLAQGAGAKLILFHAVFQSTLSGGRFFDNKRLARSRGALVAEIMRKQESRARELRRRGIAVDSIVVWEEPAYEAIIRAAIREDADLVVAGPHASRRSQFPWPLRQTDWELLRLCSRPLLLVRSDPGKDQDSCVLAALDPTHANDKPAALDQLLLQWGGAAAAALGTELHVVHSIPPSSYPLGETSAAARTKARDRIRRKLTAEVKQAQIPVARMHIASGRPELTIAEVAQELKARILVTGAISRRGLQRFAVGDTAERIISAVDCDLLIVKPQGFKLRLGRPRKEAVELPAAGKGSRGRKA